MSNFYSFVTMYPLPTVVRTVAKLFISLTAILAVFYSPAVHAQSQIFITETSCPQIGVWDSGTCTLSGDIAVPLVIQRAGVTLDGNGYTVRAGAGLNDATVSLMSTGITLKNIVIESTARQAVRVVDTAPDAVIENVALINPLQGLVIEGQGTDVTDVYVSGTNTVFGLQVQRANDVDVTRLTTNSVQIGVNVFDSSSVNISESRIENSQSGLQAEISENVVFENSIISNGSGVGIKLGNRIGVAIRNNEINAAPDASDFSTGIEISGSNTSDNTTILNNTISGWGSGVVDQTSYGFDPGGPIQVSFIPLIKSIWKTVVPTVLAQSTPNIIIATNNFLNNQISYSIPEQAADTVVLDQNGVGNYWDSFDETSEGCVDDDANQICDSFYQLSNAIPDNFPATAEFTNQFDLQAKATCNLSVPMEASLGSEVVVTYTSNNTEDLLAAGTVQLVDADGTFTYIPTATGTVTITATAFGPGGSSQCSVAVTVIDGPVEPPAPEGASSVLFLPGIQASRLYKDGVFGTEDQVWEPSVNRGQDVRQLKFTSGGVSLSDVYTKEGDVIDTASFIPGTIDDVVIYETWLKRLDQETTSGTFAAWQALAYDWRYDVLDVVTDGIVVGPADDRRIIEPLQELERLSEESPSNKVSIVAHSNGGLLAKAMLIEADKQCRLNPDGPCLIDRVDQLILLGSPQIGTPEGLKSLLHGGNTDFKSQLAVPAADFRAVAGTLPGAHTLLPLDAYLKDLSGPLVTFIGDSPDFEKFNQAYPNGIQRIEQLESFLVGTEGREYPVYRDLDRPLKLDESLVVKGRQTQLLLADWITPENIKVTEIVGVGVRTISGLRYDSFLQTVKSLSGVPGALDITKLRLGTTLYGDATVMTRSAEGYEGDKETYYVDLQVYNEVAAEVDSDSLPAKHSTLTEPADVQDIIVSLLSDVDIPASVYVSTTLPDYEGQRYDGLSTFSPVDLLIVDSEGNRTGVIRDTDGNPLILEEITNSRFFLIGSSSHAYIPSDTEYRVEINGYAEGSFSLVIEDVTEGEDSATYFRMENVVVNNNSNTTFQKADGVFGDIEIDFDGDGVNDQVRQLDGQVVDVVAPVGLQESELAQRNSSSGTRVNSRVPAPQVLGITASSELTPDQYQTLVALVENIRQLLEQQSLTSDEVQVLATILESMQDIVQSNNN